MLENCKEVGSLLYSVLKNSALLRLAFQLSTKSYIRNASHLWLVTEQLQSDTCAPRGTKRSPSPPPTSNTSGTLLVSDTSIAQKLQTAFVCLLGPDFEPPTWFCQFVAGCIYLRFGQYNSFKIQWRRGLFKENKRHPRKLHRKSWTHHGIHSLTLGSILTMECATSWQPHVSGRLELTLCHAKSHCREINTPGTKLSQYTENNAVIRDNMLLSLFDKKYMGETLPQLRWMTIRVFASVTKR